MRLLTERREDLVAERTRSLNRLHVLLRDLLSDDVRKQLSADAAANQVVAPLDAQAPGRAGPQKPGRRAGARRARPGPEKIAEL